MKDPRQFAWLVIAVPALLLNVYQIYVSDVSLLNPDYTTIEVRFSRTTKGEYCTRGRGEGGGAHTFIFGERREGGAELLGGGVIV
jgi:hypothetical protein